MSPLSISVALCTYNGAAYLPAQLRSLAEQSRLPDELVVSDDRSTDDTAGIVEAFAQRAPFLVRLVRQPVNLGSTQNFAAAMALCQGDCLALCDQDDVWLPDKLAIALAFLAEHPRCLALFTDATVVDETLRPVAEGASLWGRLSLHEPVLRRLSDPGQALDALAGGNLITGATLVIRRELAALALPIPVDLPDKLIHDGWLALVAAALGGLDCVPRQTMLYRQHDKQQVGVGAGARTSRVSRNRQERFGPVAANMQKVHALLVKRVGQVAVPGALEKLARQAAFFQHRAALPRPRRERVRRVWDEFRHGNYRRYCQRPVLAALSDIVR